MTERQTPDDATRRAAAACAAGLPATLGTDRVGFGFDGFLDTVRVLVDERRGADSFDRVERLADLGDHVVASAAQRSSVTYEWVREGSRTGGHVPHLSRALGALGYDPAMVGRFGRPPDERFETEFADRDLLSVGQPGRTDAVEFDDGKLLLAEMGPIDAFDWDRIVDRVGLDALADRFEDLALLGVGYWVDTPRLASVLDGLRTELFPTLSSPPDRVLFDPGDVRQVDAERVAAGVDALGRLDDAVPVTVSANRSETDALAAAVDGSRSAAVETGTEAGTGPGPGDGDGPGDGPETWDDGSLAAAARTAREGLGVSRFVGHVADGAVAATEERVDAVAAPRVSDPELTTSAGDHFNAGLAVGLLADLPADAALVAGCSLAGQFVRTGEAPTPGRLRAFVDGYVERFDGASG